MNKDPDRRPSARDLRRRCLDAVGAIPADLSTEQGIAPRDGGGSRLLPSAEPGRPAADEPTPTPTPTEAPPPSPGETVQSAGAPEPLVAASDPAAESSLRRRLAKPWLVGIGGFVLLLAAGGAIGAIATGRTQTSVLGSEPGQPVVGGDPAGPDGADDGEADAAQDPGARPGAGVTVTTAMPEQQRDWFQAAIVELLLTELGYEVSTLPRGATGAGAAYQAMNDGEIDYWPVSLAPLDDPLLVEVFGSSDQAADRIVPVGDLVPLGYLNGFVVPRTVASENGITSLAQINASPELVALFDEDGNGRAEIVGCIEGEPCAAEIDAMLEANGWTNLERISSTDLFLGLLNAEVKMEAGEPVLHYLLVPSATAHSLRIGELATWLSVGDESDFLSDRTEQYERFGPAPIDNCSDTPCRMVFGWSNVQLAATPDFLAANPPARALFEEMTIDSGDVSRADPGLIASHTYPQARTKAENWIDDNRSVVDEWLAAARTAS